MHKPLVFVAFLGLLVSGYLLIAHVTPAGLLCREGGGCQTVQTSPYAELFNVPIALLGVLFYLVLGILAALWNPRHCSSPGLPLTFWTGAGFSVSAWLTYLEASVINAWCGWCAVSALLATLALTIVWLRPSSQKS